MFPSLDISWGESACRIAVFVDAGYLWASLLHTTSRIYNTECLFPDFHYLFKNLRLATARKYPRADIKVLWYDAPHPFTEIDLQHAENVGIVVRRGLLSPDGRQKCIDTLITSDLISCAYEKSIDCAILLTGDIDFLPAIELCWRQGLPVSLLVNEQSALPASLLRAVHGIIQLDVERDRFLPPISSGEQVSTIVNLVVQHTINRINKAGKALPPIDSIRLPSEICQMLYVGMGRTLRRTITFKEKYLIVSVFCKRLTEISSSAVTNNDHFEKSLLLEETKSLNPFAIESLVPLPMRLLPGGFSSENLVGRRQGAFLILGLSARHRSRWVVRCDCGIYALRSAKALKNPENSLDCCTACRKKRELGRRMFIEEHGRHPTDHEEAELLALNPAGEGFSSPFGRFQIGTDL